MTALDFDRLRTLRATAPAIVARSLVSRPRRALFVDDRRLFIIAADHTARGAFGIRSQPMAMGDRYDLLERLAAALANPAVDGVLATPDILQDLAVLGRLDGKLAVGSMNRGGLSGATFEMDDRVTAYGPADLATAGVDFAKFLLRVNLADPGSAATLERAAEAVTASARAELPIMLEPFLSRWQGDAIVNDLDADSVIRSVAIASGLGASTAYTWLKLPVVEQMDRVMAATTLPTLLLGGDPDSGPDETFASWERALALPGVRGLVVGRTLLYPADDDVDAAVGTAARLVHGDIRSPIPQRTP
ncbi:MAG: deoxyribose-phosphate aldolase [Microbacteriaceae bacterium]|nr:deoxyribose-phosphate aldolase [Microbacteriaceae bacterium]